VPQVTAQEIERLVREVLAQLAPSAAPPASTPSTIELWLEQRVITVGDLERRLARVQTVVAPPDAIITPAAKDLLREKRITVRRATPPAKKTPLLRAPLLLGVAETNFDPSRVIDYLARRGVQVEPIARTGMKTVVAELAEEVSRSGRRAWLLTESTQLATCLANRTPGVWAATANHRGELRTAQRTISINFTITAPQNLSWIRLAQIAQLLSSPET
jgi:hypothetical protein